MYEAIRGVDGPGAEGICSDIIVTVLAAAQCAVGRSLFTRYFDKQFNSSWSKQQKEFEHPHRSHHLLFL